MGQQAVYSHWEGDQDKGTVVLMEDLNEVHIAKRLKPALGPHRFGKVLDPKTNEVKMGYIPLQHEHEEYPKMLYHPDHGKKPEPKLTDYAAGCTTPEQSMKAHEAYNQAHAEWQKKNRVKLVQNAKEEKRLVDKCWLVKRPTPPVPPESQESDEI